MKKKKVHFLAYAPDLLDFIPACRSKRWDDAIGDIHNVTCLKCVRSKEYVNERVKKIGEIIEKIISKPRESDEVLVERMLKVLLPSAKSIKVKKISEDNFEARIVPSKPVEKIEINIIV